jgi:hypothetical protein
VLPNCPPQFSQWRVGERAQAPSVALVTEYFSADFGPELLQNVHWHGEHQLLRCGAERISRPIVLPGKPSCGNGG